VTEAAHSENRRRRPRVRRARCLIGRWEDREFILENYLTGKQTAVSPAVVQLLDSVNEYEALTDILTRIDLPVLGELVDKLIDRDLLVGERSRLDEKERLVESTWTWGQDARYFHYSTNHVDFESDPEAQGIYLSVRAKQVPPPSPYKEYGHTGIDLGRRLEQRTGEFWEVLLRRRTCRSFTGESISREEFADILAWTWGQTQAFSFPTTGDFVVKTSPSGGARHPMETYPVVLAVQGVEPGIYHYSVRQNSLIPLRIGKFADLVVELCSNHRWVREAAAVFFMTAVIERSTWKYQHSHAYRVLQLDAGHVGQTFHLVCTRLGLGPFTFAATQNQAIERELGLDGVSEIVVYTAAVGVPTRSSRE
jgi:SagB-type dehydrogenase family enzyme